MSHSLSHAFFVVDAFADRPFAGNPAAVLVLDRPAEEAWMRLVAREMNLSETAFLHPERGEDGRPGYRLRWFTPTVEVPLCGHATLASAHVLWETGRLGPGEPARFFTRSGVLGARRLAAGGDGNDNESDCENGSASGGGARENRTVAAGPLIELDFPARPTRPATPPPGLLEALGVTSALAVHREGLRDDWLIELGDEVAVRALAPNFTALAALSGLDVRGVVVTARASLPPNDFVSRFFVPAEGIPEDPVTGAAHCMLATYWTERLAKPGAPAPGAGPTLVGYQASERGGTVRVQLRGDRVDLRGHAITISRGELLAAAES